MLNIMASFAEFEREIIAARIADSRAQLKERHLRFAGAVPLGYDSDRRTKQLVPNPMEAEIVRWMFAEAASGKRPAEIATNANARRFRTKANGPWSARQVVATLRNPVYVGRFKDGNGVRPACHEPICDTADCCEWVQFHTDLFQVGSASLQPIEQHNCVLHKPPFCPDCFNRIDNVLSGRNHVIQD